ASGLTPIAAARLPTVSRAEPQKNRKITSRMKGMLGTMPLSATLSAGTNLVTICWITPTTRPPTKASGRFSMRASTTAEGRDQQDVEGVDVEGDQWGEQHAG